MTLTYLTFRHKEYAKTGHDERRRLAASPGRKCCCAVGCDKSASRNYNSWTCFLYSWTCFFKSWTCCPHPATSFSENRGMKKGRNLRMGVSSFLYVKGSTFSPKRQIGIFGFNISPFVRRVASVRSRCRAECARRARNEGRRAVQKSSNRLSMVRRSMLHRRPQSGWP